MKAQEIIESFKALKDLKFEGTDTDLDESLFECGMIWAEEGTDYVFLYRTYMEKSDKEIYIGVARFSKDTDFYKEFDWCDLGAILSHNGMSNEDWDNLPITTKIFDVSTYHGPENVFGYEYHPLIFSAVTWYVSDKDGEIIYSGPHKGQAMLKHDSLPKDSGECWWENDVTGDFDHI